jgi:hypothetical protein
MTLPMPADVGDGVAATEIDEGVADVIAMDRRSAEHRRQRPFNRAAAR